MSSDVLTSNLIVSKNRIKVYSMYKNALGAYVTTRSDAIQLEIIVLYDQYMKAITEDYEDTAAFGSGVKTEQSVQGISGYSTAISDYTVDSDHYDDDTLSNTIKNALDSTFDSFSLKIIYLNDKMNLTADLIKTIFSTYKQVYFDFNYLKSWVEIPSASYGLELLSIKNGNIKLHKCTIDCSDSIYIDNCAFTTDDVTPEVMLSSREDITISNIYIAKPIYIKLFANIESDNAILWKKTVHTVSNVTITFEDLYAPEKGKYYDSILTSVGAYKVAISGYKSMYDIPYYPMLRLTNSNRCDLSDLVRASIKLPASSSTIICKNITQLNVSGIVYNGAGDASDNATFFSFPVSSVLLKVSISTFTLNKIGFCNFAGFKCASFYVSNGTCSGTSFGNFTASGIADLSLSGITFKGDKFDVYANSMSISECTINSTTIKLSCLDNLSAKDTNIIGTDFTVDVADSSSQSFNNCKFTVDNFIGTASSTLSTDYDAYANQALAIRDTNINAKKFSVSDIYRVTLDNVMFDKLNDLILKTVSRCVLKTTMQYGGASVSTDFDAVNFDDSGYYVLQPNRSPKFNFNNCTGIFIVKMDEGDSGTNAGNTTLVNLIGSKLKFQLYSDESRIIKLNSSDSCGSNVNGISSTVSVTPDMESKDISSFAVAETSSSYDSNKVYYGTVTK